MIVIVEGLDRCGKSTLIKHIRKHILTNPKTTSIHCSSPPSGSHSDWSKDHYTSLLKTIALLNNDGWDIILDRSHLGEDVYGPLFRNQEAKYIYDLENEFFNNIDVRLILLIDDPIKLLERDDGDSPTANVSQIQSVLDTFLKAFNQSNISNKKVINISDIGGFTYLNTIVQEFINADC